MISTPVNSPCAPAAGCSETASKPLISFSHSLQLVHQRQISLHGFHRLQRMREEKAGQSAGIFVDLRVVLHRARTQRIEATVHAVVERAQVHVVADDIDLSHFGQGQVDTQQARGKF